MKEVSLGQNPLLHLTGWWSPAKLVAKKDSVLVPRTLCQYSLLKKTVLVEIYSPSDKPIQLYSKITLGTTGSRFPAAIG